MVKVFHVKDIQSWRVFLNHWNQVSMEALKKVTFKYGLHSGAAGTIKYFEGIGQEMGQPLDNRVFEEGIEYPGKTEQETALIAERLVLFRQAAQTILDYYVAKGYGINYSEDDDLVLLVRGSILFDGASDQDIGEAESRLGLILPPSYKNFLKASNGLILPGGKFLPANEIDWFKDKVTDYYRIICDARFGLEVSDEEHRTYGDKQNPLLYCSNYLEDCVSISLIGDANMFSVLNSKIRFEEGEWEAWYCCSEEGCARYQAFNEFMGAFFDRLDKMGYWNNC